MGLIGGAAVGVGVGAGVGDGVGAGVGAGVGVFVGVTVGEPPVVLEEDAVPVVELEVEGKPERVPVLVEDVVAGGLPVGGLGEGM